MFEIENFRITIAIAARPQQC